MKSVMSFPERGNYGKSNWRGNTSGYVIKDLIEHFKPKLFVDACEGSGTSKDVCKELNIDYVGLDLFKGNDFTKDLILEQLPKPADICFTHPPYHNMIQYSGNVYGNKKLDGDTSYCNTSEEFISKSQVMLLNQREATKEGGIYTTLIGDQRGGGIGKGNFISYQADFIKMMPKDELLSVAIKLQHNCLSDNRTYNGNFIPIQHEYLIIWKKKAKSLFQVSFDIASDLQKKVATTWRNAIRAMNPRTVVVEEVVEYSESSASMMLRMVLKQMGYKISETVSESSNTKRKRWCLVADMNNLINLENLVDQSKTTINDYLEKSIDEREWKTAEENLRVAGMIKKGLGIRSCLPSDNVVNTFTTHSTRHTEPILKHPTKELWSGN